MQKISENEIRNVLKLTPHKRYKYFIKRIVGFNYVWLLSNEDGKWAEAHLNKHKLISLWSAKEFAELLIEGPWEGFFPEKMSLEDFYYTLKKNYNGEDFLINVFSKPSKTGFIVDLDEFKRDILEELDKYSL